MESYAGDWSDYSVSNLRALKAAIAKADYAKAVKIWNDMSGMQITVSKDTISTDETIPVLDFPEEV
jgi:hypothetical protein